MIINNLSQLDRYSDLFPCVVKFITSKDIMKVPNGKHELSECCFVLVNEYKTNLECDDIFENHHDYIDFQLIVSGRESIGYSSVEKMQLEKEYDHDNDYELFKGDGEFVHLTSGDFAVFYPGEAHKPGLAYDDHSEHVRKIVFKIKA